MKIALINPPFLTNYGKYSRPSRSPAITKSGTIYYPIILATAGAVLEKEGHDVTFIDACAYEYNEIQTIRLVYNANPQIVVIDTSTPSILSDIKFALNLKKVLPNIFVVLVGPHVTALDEDILKNNDHIDAIARKEYEYTLRELAAKFPIEGMYAKEIIEPILSTIDGLTYRIGNKIYKNKDREYINNLDELPFVTEFYKKHLDINKYNSSIGYNPLVMIHTGRGCIGKCIFCVYPQIMYGNKYRFRSVENIINEFCYIRSELPEVKTVGIEDDTFTLNKERVLKVCEELLKLNIAKKIKWWANTRINTLDYQTMVEMKKAGCYMLIAGFESGNQNILNNIEKEITIEQSEKFMLWAKKAGLMVHGCFMIGNFGETKETARKTIKFAKKLNPDTAQFFPLILSPGTKAYNYAKDKKWLKTEDYSKWVTRDGLHNSVIELPGLSSEEVMSLCKLARREFYLRPKYIFKKINNSIKNKDELIRNIKGFKNLIKHLF